MPRTVLSWQPSMHDGRVSHRQHSCNTPPRQRPSPQHPARCQASSRLTETDLQHLRQAAALSASSAGLTQPHPNAGCLLTTASGAVVAEAFQRAQGTEPPEVQAVRHAQGAAAGGTAYLNLESGDCHGETAAVQALIGGGVARVVVGLRHPLSHLRSEAIRSLQAAGVQVDVLREARCEAAAADEEATYAACLHANEALLHRAATKRPLGLLKYAMTLDGKIATQTGHSAWVTSPESRAVVFETRSLSDAVVVGGQTVRRDNPQLTTRREGGHLPARIVLSRTLDLPEDAKLWDVSAAPTIVMTQRRVRSTFQARLRDRGVEVIEFDFLTPDAVAEYCYARGFMQLLWECGGMLAAPAIAGNAIHKVMAFVAPKLIGGPRAPTPVGELGFVEMTQALELCDTHWRQVGPDLLMTGYLPCSGGLPALADRAAALSKLPGLRRPVAGVEVLQKTANDMSLSSKSCAEVTSSVLLGCERGRAVEFYKAWDPWGALSNFSPHPITLAEGPVPAQGPPRPGAPTRRFSSVEHFYQSQKFSGVPEATVLYEAIIAAPSPEEAARLGRTAERQQPQLLRPDWPESKVAVMRAGLGAKFAQHAAPRRLLLESGMGDLAGSLLIEASPHDVFWGRGFDGRGENMLGKVLMELREALLGEEGARQDVAQAVSA